MLSALTLVLVLYIAFRPVAAPDRTVLTAVNNMRGEIGTVRGDISALRTIIVTGGSESGADELLAQLDRVETAIEAVRAKLDSICAAIQGSPFAPSGFSC
jgi:hypothetical protein